MNKLYITEHNGRALTHDGTVQLGYFSVSVEEHIKLNPLIDWEVTDWAPDPASYRSHDSYNVNP